MLRPWKSRPSRHLETVNKALEDSKLSKFKIFKGGRFKIFKGGRFKISKGGRFKIFKGGRFKIFKGVKPKAECILVTLQHVDWHVCMRTHFCLWSVKKLSLHIHILIHIVYAYKRTYARVSDLPSFAEEGNLHAYIMHVFDAALIALERGWYW